MRIHIESPNQGARLPLDEPVVFAGTATDDVTRVALKADDEFDLGEAAVDDGGAWRLTRQFSVGAERQITVTGLDAAGETLETDALSITLVRPAASCANRVVAFTVDDANAGILRKVFRFAGDDALFYVSGMTICVDGSPRAYCKGNRGLDTLANATTNGKVNGPLNPDIMVFGSDGIPVVQSDGCFIAQTALQDSSRSRTNPARYVNAETIPFIVLPGIPKVRQNNVIPGDLAAVFSGVTQSLCFAVYGDVGPAHHLGEGSLFLAEKLGFTEAQRNPRTGGVEDGVFYVVFPGSRLDPRWSSDRTSDDIARAASPLFEAWGGLARLRSCFAEMT